MLSTIADFASLLLMSLVVGAMFAVWLIFNPSGLDAATYVTQQQHAIRTLNVVMPLLGLVTLLATIASAMLARGDHMRLALIAAAAVCLLAAGLITRFLNQPINAIVSEWTTAWQAENWMQLRDAWWRWHVLRLGAGLGGLSLMIAATMSKA